MRREEQGVTEAEEKGGKAQTGNVRSIEELRKRVLGRGGSDKGCKGKEKGRREKQNKKKCSWSKTK